MAVHLDLKRIFSGPFGAEPLLLRRFADRAIPLLSVLPVIGVAIRTMRLAGVDSRYGLAVNKDVLCLSNALKMVWVNAVPVPTLVINNKVIADLPVLGIPRYTMGSSVLSSKEKSPVSVLIEGANPETTFGSRVNLRLGSETIELIISKVHSYILSMARKVAWPKDRSQYGLV